MTQGGPDITIEGVELYIDIPGAVGTIAPSEEGWYVTPAILRALADALENAKPTHIPQSMEEFYAELETRSC